MKANDLLLIGVLGVLAWAISRKAPGAQPSVGAPAPQVPVIPPINIAPVAPDFGLTDPSRWDWESST